MPDNFAITAASTTVRLDEAKTGTISFTVTNQTSQPRRGRAKISAQNPDHEQWILVGGEAERGFVGHGTQQYTVNIAAPVDALAGTHSFRLDMVGTENPDEDYTQGPSVSFTLPEAKRPEKKPARVPKLPWWVPLVAAVVVGGIVGGTVVGVLASRPATVDVEPYAGTWFDNEVPQQNDLAFVTLTPSGTALSMHSFSQCGQTTCDLGTSIVTCTDKQCSTSIHQKGRVDKLTLTLPQGKTPGLQIVDTWTAGLSNGSTTINYHQATQTEMQAQQYVGAWVYVPTVSYYNFNYWLPTFELIITRQQTSLQAQAPIACEASSNCSPGVATVQFSTTTPPEFTFSYCDSVYHYVDDLKLTLSSDGETLQVAESLTVAHRTAAPTCAIAAPLGNPLTFQSTMRREGASDSQTPAAPSLSGMSPVALREVDG